MTRNSVITKTLNGTYRFKSDKLHANALKRAAQHIAKERKTLGRLLTTEELSFLYKKHGDVVNKVS